MTEVETGAVYLVGFGLAGSGLNCHSISWVECRLIGNQSSECCTALLIDTPCGYCFEHGDPNHSPRLQIQRL